MTRLVLVAVAFVALGLGVAWYAARRPCVRGHMARVQQAPTFVIVGSVIIPISPASETEEFVCDEYE